MAKTEEMSLEIAEEIERENKRYKLYQRLMLILFGVTIIIPIIILGILIVLGRLS